MENTTMGMAGVWRFGFVAVPSVVLVLFPDLAFAAVNNDIATAVCDISDSFTGQVATGIGTIAVCTVASMACLGRVQWSTAILCAVGIALLFGAATVAQTLATAGGGTFYNCT